MTWDLRIKTCFLKKRIFFFLLSPIFTQVMFSYLCGFQKDKDTFKKVDFFIRRFIMEILKTFYSRETSIMSLHFSHCSSSALISTAIPLLSPLLKLDYWETNPSHFYHSEQEYFSAKSLRSCPTVCDPIDGRPPGSPIPGILQARTLEWVAISYSNAWKWKVKSESEVAQLCLTLSDPTDCGLPGSSVHGIFQASVLEWVAIAFSEYFSTYL